MNQEAKGIALLHCLGMQTDETRAVRLEQLSSSDWDEVIQLSLKHGVAPLLYHRFRMNTHIPAEAMQKLRKIYLHNVVRNTRLYAELSKVFRALKSKDIPIVILKGAALAEVIYQNIALRPMADIDLLAKGKDMWGADEVLLQLGYKSNTKILYSKRHIKWVRHITYTNVSSYLELHPGISELSSIDLWANVSPAKIASTDVFILGLEDFLLHLCTHMNTHFLKGETQLIWWCDIAKMLERYGKELDWDYVIRIAGKQKVEGIIYRILHATNRLFDGRIPMDVLRRLKSDDAVLSINDILYPTGELMKRKKSREINAFLSRTWKLRSVNDKFCYVFRSVFPCKNYMIYRYSITRPICVYYYYLVRVCIGVRKTIKSILSKRE